MAFDIRDAVAASLGRRGSADALAFGGRWRSWDWLGAYDRLLADLVPASAPCALIARNRPGCIAAVAASVARGRTTRMIYSVQSPAGIAADIERVGAPIILADPQDWTVAAIAATRATGALGLAIDDGAQPEIQVVAPARDGATFLKTDPSIAFEILSSGTTGTPKRLPLGWSTVSAAAADAGLVYAGTAARDAPQLILHPLGNIAGISYLLPILAFGQRMVLIEKFGVDVWVEAVRRYRPVRSALPAAALRMVLEADVDRSALASLALVAVGGSKLDSGTQDAFEARFGVPVLTAYGASEFAGVIAGWTLDLYEVFGKTKRGSAGRASPNVTLRIVDAETSVALPPGETGLLEARVARLGTDWVRTNDLATIDADGFLFVTGRADGAIDRGGFKIVPDIVANALRQHPAVADAAVVGRIDARLGEVPVAAVELVGGANADEKELLAFLRDRLIAYQLPAEIRILASLPRNPSMKVALGEVKALFADRQ